MRRIVRWCHQSLRHRRRGAALYVAVMFTALLVSLLGLTGLTLVRVERERASYSTGIMTARHNARSAVELALLVIFNDSDWRNTYTNGVETNKQLLGSPEHGTVSWVLEDTDGRLDDADTELRLHGVGRLGTTVQVLSIEITEVLPEVGPQELRSQTSTAAQALDTVSKWNWWCQYVKVSLPADAIGWKITSVELYAKKWYAGEMLNVRVYEPLPSNMPSTTTIDSVDLTGAAFNLTMSWESIDFSGDYMLAPDDGVCIAFEASHPWKSPIQFAYEGSGVSEPDSALIRGNPTWTTYETDKALMYRVHGVYFTAGEDTMQPIMGTWRRDAAPTP